MASFSLREAKEENEINQWKTLSGTLQNQQSVQGKSCKNLVPPFISHVNPFPPIFRRTFDSYRANQLLTTTQSGTESVNNQSDQRSSENSQLLTNSRPHLSRLFKKLMKRKIERGANYTANGDSLGSFSGPERLHPYKHLSLLEVQETNLSMGE